MFVVTIHFKSGRAYRFLCREFSATKSSNNDLTGFQMSGRRGEEMLYTRLEEIEQITDRKARWWDRFYLPLWNN